MISAFSFPTAIRFGAGVRKEVAQHLISQRLSRPLVVTDRGFAGLAPFAQFVEILTAGGLRVATFAGVHGNPVESQVVAGVAAFRAHDADAIIGIGGGAALDVAKAIAVMASHPGALFDYEDGRVGALQIDRALPYWVALPTTAGTGSEVGRSAVIADEATHVKRIVFSPRLMARAVFADPELTVGLPSAVTAATGMDALTHCIEAFLAKEWHPICDGVALEGMRLAAIHLERAVRDGTDIEARAGMLMASMMGAIAFQKGLGVCHSCAHALSAVSDLHHGLANGLMIDHALRHNLVGAAERFRLIARALELARDDGAAVIAWLAKLKQAIGIPVRLSETKVRREDLPRLVDLALADGCHQNNPVPCARDDFVRIFEQAW